MHGKNAKETQKNRSSDFLGLFTPAGLGGYAVSGQKSDAWVEPSLKRNKGVPRGLLSHRPKQKKGVF